MSTSPGAGHVRNVLAPVTPLTQRLAIDPPEPLTRFVGRKAEVAAACALLQRPHVRLLTLTGPGGIGKTRLALVVATAMLANFPDGIAWAPLAAINDPALVLPAVAASVGIVASQPAGPIDQIQVALHDRRLLLLIDNVEQVVAAAADIARLLVACPTLTVLATSREPLHISGEHILTVSPLDLPSLNDASPLEPQVQTGAVRLFAERATAASPDFRLDATTTPHVVRICQRLEGLPLAIELAAAWVRYLPLETLGERVEHRLPFLTGGPQDAPARLRTMRDAIRWSHDLLPAPERTLFRRLAVFPGGCTLDSAEAVAGTEAAVVLSGIVSLVDKSLLTLGVDTDGTPRYRMLDTIREFAREELDASGEAAATWRAHADWLLALADQHSLEPFLPDDQAWLNRLETEHANLREVMAWLDRNGDTQRMAGLAGALGWFWFVRSHFHEGRAALERALAHDDIPAPLRTKMIVVLGLIVVMEGEFPQVAERVARELAAARAARNTPGASQLLILLGVDATIRGAYDEATAFLDEALALAASLDDPRLRVALASAARSNLGVVYRGQGRLAEAVATLEAAVAGHRTTGSVRGELLTLGDLGDVARDSGNYTLARDRFREALTLAWRFGEQRAIVDGLEAVAYLAIAVDQPGSTTRLLAAAERLRERQGLLGQVPLGRATWAQAVSAARNALGKEAFAAAWASGRSLEADAAVGEALTALEPPPAGSNVPRMALTARERDVIRLLVAGHTDRAIGEALFIGTRTVESHVSRIFAKLGVRTRAAAVATAIARGLVDPPEPAAGKD